MIHSNSAIFATMIEYKHRLKEAMGTLSVQFVADGIGISYQGVKRVLEGKSRAFSAENNSKAAKFLNVRADWLATGDGAMRLDTQSIDLKNELTHIMSTSSGAQDSAAQMREATIKWANLEPRPAVSGNIPLISWVRAGDFCDSPDNFAPGDAEEFMPRPLQNMGKYVFALTVRGDSMDTPDGYREGEIVYVDPDKSPVPGQDVVAKVGDKLNLKRYKEDQDGPYLLQLNGNIIIRPQGEWSICGVVVFSGKRR